MSAKDHSPFSPDTSHSHRSTVREAMARNQFLMDLHWLRFNGDTDVSVSVPTVDQDGIDLILHDGWGHAVPVQLKSKLADSTTGAWRIEGALVYPRPEPYGQACIADGAVTGGHGGALIVQVLHKTKEWPYMRAWYRVGNIVLAALMRGRNDGLYIKKTQECRPLNPRVSWPESLTTAPRDARDLLLLLGLSAAGTKYYSMMRLDRYPSDAARNMFRDAEQRAQHRYQAWCSSLGSTTSAAGSADEGAGVGPAAG